MTNKTIISAEFPFESKFIDILSSKMHYIDEGDKNSEHTFLLLHGNPTSSYLWRNIIPHLSPLGRVVVPDLIGMGKSDKPDIDYTFENHIAYIDGFIDKLNLKNIVLVHQDWGSAIGFNYANRKRSNVSAIAFFEAVVEEFYWKDVTDEMRETFQNFRNPETGYEMIVKNNLFVEHFLPVMAGRKLTDEEMNVYRSPYLEEKHRKPLFVWPSEIPFDGHPKYSADVVNAYNEYLKDSEIPKLMFHAKPGMIITPEVASKIIKTWKNIETIDLGEGLHFLQESHPHQIGEGIVNWYKTKIKE